MTEPEPAPPVKRDGFAVPSLLTGVLGFFGVTAVLGVVFGIVTLVRTRRTGERGRGLAIGGVVARAGGGGAPPRAGRRGGGGPPGAARRAHPPVPGGERYPHRPPP